MEKLLDDYFTIYINKKNNEVQGFALKSLEKSMEMIELSSDMLNILNEYPLLLNVIDQGYLIQIYKSLNYSYIIQIAKHSYGGPCNEIDVLYILKEYTSYTIYNALENANENLIEKDIKKPLQKAYRYYGQDKYITADTYLPIKK